MVYFKDKLNQDYNPTSNFHIDSTIVGDSKPESVPGYEGLLLGVGVGKSYLNRGSIQSSLAIRMSTLTLSLDKLSVLGTIDGVDVSLPESKVQSCTPGNVHVYLDASKQYLTIERSGF